MCTSILKYVYVCCKVKMTHEGHKISARLPKTEYYIFCALLQTKIKLVYHSLHQQFHLCTNFRNKVDSFTAGTQTRASRARESSVTHKSAIIDHAVEENYVIDWDKAKVVDREAQRQTTPAACTYRAIHRLSRGTSTVTYAASTSQPSRTTSYIVAAV